MDSMIIAVCDSSEKYSMSICSELMNQLGEPFRVIAFTGFNNLWEYARGENIWTLIITESEYQAEVQLLEVENLVVLTEGFANVPDGVKQIDRFQSREALIHSIIEMLPEDVSMKMRASRSNHWKVIGVYSPVHRSLQTSFAMTLGQTLARNHRVLYLNFENYSGLSGIMNKEFEANVIDLLYFFDCDKEKLAKRLALTVHDVNGMDILPPANAYFDTYDRTGDRWIEFLQAIEQVSDYEYLILDLTDAMQGLLEVLEYCDRIYTLVKSDTISRAKLAQYEEWMMVHSKAGIIGKTMKFNLPEFTDIPSQPQLMTKSELASYVKAVIRDDSLEEINRYE